MNTSMSPGSVTDADETRRKTRIRGQKRNNNLGGAGQWRNIVLATLAKSKEFVGDNIIKSDDVTAIASELKIKNISRTEQQIQQVVRDLRHHIKKSNEAPKFVKTEAEKEAFDVVARKLGKREVDVGQKKKVGDQKKRSMPASSVQPSSAADSHGLESLTKKVDNVAKKVDKIAEDLALFRTEVLQALSKIRRPQKARKKLSKRRRPEKKNSVAVAAAAEPQASRISTETEIMKEPGNADISREEEGKMMDEAPQPTATASTSSTTSDDSCPSTPSTPTKKVDLLSAIQSILTPVKVDVAEPVSFQPRSTHEELAKCEITKYPPNENDPISILFEDVWRIVHMKWLNDKVVEFGIRYTLYNLNKERKEKIHLKNTFFYPKFAGVENDKSGAFIQRYAENRKNLLEDNYGKIRRWTKNVDIFNKDFIVIPVNDKVRKHWYLIIVAYPERAMRKKEEPVEEAPTKPDELCQIFVFDSMADHKDPERCRDYMNIRDYLRLEFKDKKANKEPSRRFSEKHISAIQLKNLPMQDNQIDCGVYVVAYLEAFLTKKIPAVDQNKSLDLGNWQSDMSPLDIGFHRATLLKRIKNHSDKVQWNKYVRDFERNVPANATVL